MAKKKLNISKEVSKIWQQAKINLADLGKRTMHLAQKGEKEVRRASKIGKLQLDVVSINLKKDNIFRQIGKKIYEMHGQKEGIDTAKLMSSFNQIDKLNAQIKDKKGQINKFKKE